MIGRDRIERICRNAGMVPVKRESVRGVQVFIADGFSAPPHHCFRRFGIEPTEFPFGMFVTLWWVSKGDEELDTGQPLFFDAFHDPDISRSDKQRARINSALEHAGAFLERRTKVRLNG